MNVIFHRITSYTWNFQNFTCVITILVKFDIHFLGLPWEIFFGVTTDVLLHLKPLKNVKKNSIFFKLFWYKVFVHWKLKLLNFLVDFVLTTFVTIAMILKVQHYSPKVLDRMLPHTTLNIPRSVNYMKNRSTLSNKKFLGQLAWFIFFLNQIRSVVVSKSLHSPFTVPG